MSSAGGQGTGQDVIVQTTSAQAYGFWLGLARLWLRFVNSCSWGWRGRIWTRVNHWLSCNGRVVGQEALLICRTAPPDRIVKLNTGFIIGFVFCLRLGRVHGYIIVNVKFMFHVRLSLPFPVACIALGTLVAGQHVCSACWQLLGWYAQCWRSGSGSGSARIRIFWA